MLSNSKVIQKWNWSCQIVSPDESVVCILTGHQLKDPNATVQYHTGGENGAGTGRFCNAPVVVANDLARILDVLQQALHSPDAAHGHTV